MKRLWLFVVLLSSFAAAQDGDVFTGIGTIERMPQKDGVPDGALKDRVFVTEDVTYYLDATVKAPDVGSRVWLKGTLKSKIVKISEVEVLPKSIPKKAEGKTFSVELDEVYPWCDHMPIMQKGERRQYLIVKASLTNKTDKDLDVSLARSFLSFDESKEGAVVTGLSAKGETKFSIKAGQTAKVQLRGDNLYEEGNHDKTLYATLAFSAGEERLWVRGSGSVLATQ